MHRLPRHTLLAAALLAVGTAQAQTPATQVTLYGLLDAAVGSFRGASTGVNALDANVRGVLPGGMSTSHFGVRGSEDLGGGWSAAFELSSFMRNDTGSVGRGDAIGAPVNVAGDPFWSRQSWVGVQNASLGRLRLGNTSTPMFINSIVSNAFADSTVFSPLNLVTFIGGPLTGGTGWTNQIAWDSPRWGGFGASAAIALSEGQGGRNHGWRLYWADSAATLSLAGQDVKKNPLTFADGTSANNTRSWQLGGSYDLKTVKLFAHLGRIENRGTEAAPVSVNYRLWEVSASVPLGSGRVLAGIVNRKTSDTPAPVPATAAGGNVQRQVLSAGYDHDLSRRTDLYVMWMRDSTDTRIVATPPRVVSASGSSGAIGIRHRF